MTITALAGLWLYSMIGALVPLLPVEVAVAGAAATYGSGWLPAIVVSLVASSGMMAGKFQIYGLGRGGRSVGGSWLRARMNRDVTEAALAMQHAETMPLGSRLPSFMRVSANTLGVPAVLISSTAGIPPFAIVSAAAGVARMSWWKFLTVGTCGRFIRFMIVYKGLELALTR